MANFKPTVLKKILYNEGNYCNDPDDTGGETWQGVARNANPKWRGWIYIDAIKKANPAATNWALQHKYGALNIELLKSNELADAVAQLYEAQYWDVNNLDSVTDQQLAANVCDSGVNCGTYTGATMLQKSYNAAYPAAKQLVVDGKIGNGTLGAINGSNPILVYNQYNTLRKAYYDAIIARRPVMAKYKASWYSRIIPYKA